MEDGWPGVGGSCLGVVEGGKDLLEEHAHHGKHGHTAVLHLGLAPLLELLEGLAGAVGGREGGREGGEGMINEKRRERVEGREGEREGGRKGVPEAQGVEETKGGGGAGLHHLTIGQAFLVHLRGDTEGGRERGGREV